MRPFLSIFITGILCTLLTFFLTRHFYESDKITSKIRPNQTLVSAATIGRQATVWIQDQDENGFIDTTSTAAGSGVLITPDGFIATNYHVVSRNKNIHVTLNDKREYVATFIAADTSIDVALIKIEESGLPFVEFSDSDSIHVGEAVISVGNPHRLTFTVTSGIISSLSRPASIPNNRTPYFIQTDVPINNGNSGGALLNADGKLIGLLIGYVTTTGAYEGFSLAIPGNIVHKVTSELKEMGASQRGRLAMTIRNVNKDDANAAGMTSYDGVVIDALTAGSSADSAGLRSLDIITSWNGTTVIGKKDFLEKLMLSKPGEVVKFNVRRGREDLVMEVKLE